MILFIGTCFIAWLFSWSASKKDKKKLLIVPVLMLSLLAGLRARSVGIDTGMYNDIFYNVSRGIYSPNIEAGYLLFAKALISLFNQTQAVFLTTAFLTNGLIINRFWSLKRYVSFPGMVFLYLVCFYQSTFNTMRQCLAVAIVFAATEFLEKKKYYFFLLAFFVAFLFHYSAAVAIILLPVFVIRNFRFQNRTAAAILVCMAGAVVLCISVFAHIFITRYLKYFLESNNSLGLLVISKLILVAAFIVTGDRKMQSEPSSSERRNARGVYTTLYIIALLLNFMGYYQSSLTRVSFYLMIFEYPYICYVCRYARLRKLLIPSYAAYSLLIIGSVLFSDTAGLFPYSLCF